MVNGVKVETITVGLGAEAQIGKKVWLCSNSWVKAVTQEIEDIVVHTSKWVVVFTIQIVSAARCIWCVAKYLLGGRHVPW